jgi:hypothetical protein
MKAKDRNHPGHGGGEETAGTVMTESLVIASRFCGPPGSGNGGYVRGRIAAARAVWLTVRRPVPALALKAQRYRSRR